MWDIIIIPIRARGLVSDQISDRKPTARLTKAGFFFGADGRMAAGMESNDGTRFFKA